MCLANNDPESPPKEAHSPRSPWMKLLNRQGSKPKLPRKVTNTTRVNLNKCWAKLGELISNSSANTDLPSHKTANTDETLVIPFSEYFYPLDPVKPVQLEDNDNAKNQKILSMNRFELMPDQEISDNIANEVREICYESNHATCFVCKLCC